MLEGRTAVLSAVFCREGWVPFPYVPLERPCMRLYGPRHANRGLGP